MNPSSFQLESLGLMYMVPCRLRTVQALLLPHPCGFLSFSRRAAAVKTLSTTLNNAGEKGHPHLVPDLGGQALRSDAGRRLLLHGLHCVEACARRSTLFRAVIRNRGWILSEAFSAAIRVATICILHFAHVRTVCADWGVRSRPRYAPG